MSDILYLDDNDDVLDVINDLPDDVKTSCLKFLSEHPDKGSSFVFLLPDRGYGVIMKFIKQDDEGLIMMGAANAEDIVFAIEQFCNTLSGVERQEVEERLNSIRYSFAKIKEAYLSEVAKGFK